MNMQPDYTDLNEAIAEFIRERDAALIALDLEWARRTIVGRDMCEVALLIGMHRARYNIVTLPDAARHESAEWLRARGLTDMCGMPLLPPGQLPAAAS